jgi:hypothetical protein
MWYGCSFAFHSQPSLLITLAVKGAANSSNGRLAESSTRPMSLAERTVMVIILLLEYYNLENRHPTCKSLHISYKLVAIHKNKANRGHLHFPSFL